MVKAPPVVSVITPCWNSTRFLRQTYESLRTQTLTDWEWVVGDDGSTDGSLDLLRELAATDERVVPLSLPHTGLPASGRNAALQASRGEFLAFLDSDDLFLPAKLQAQVDALRQNPACGLTYSHVEEFWDEATGRTGPAPTFWPRIDLPGNAFPVLMARGNCVCTSSIMIPRRVYEEVGAVDTTPALRAYEDYEYLLRITRRLPLIRTPGVLARYRVHAQSVSRVMGVAGWQALRDRLEAGGMLAGPEGAAFLSGYHFARAEAGLAGDPGIAVRREFLAAIRLQPGNLPRWVGLLSLVLPNRAFLSVFRWLKHVQSRLAGRQAFPHTMVSRRE